MSLCNYGLALIMDCQETDWPLSYLGLPLGGNPNTKGFWDPVAEKVVRRLDGWKKAFLSLGGRITLIQSCLSHIPSYFLSLFRIPVSVAKRLKKLQRDFLWSGAGEGKKDHLLRWEVVLQIKGARRSRSWEDLLEKSCTVGKMAMEIS